MSEEQKIQSLIWETPIVCVGKLNTDKSTYHGKFFGWIVIDDYKWAIVQWEERYPELYKADDLLIEETQMVPIA